MKNCFISYVFYTGKGPAIFGNMVYKANQLPRNNDDLVKVQKLATELVEKESNEKVTNLIIMNIIALE